MGAVSRLALLALPVLAGCQVPVLGAADPLVSYAIQSDQDSLSERASALSDTVNQQIRTDPAFADISSVTILDRDLRRETRPVCYVVVAGTLDGKGDLPRLKEVVTSALGDQCRVAINSSQIAAPGIRRYRSR